MSVQQWGKKLQALYLERFQPTEGVSTRICVLESTRVIALQSHFLNHPEHDIVGMFECIKGICCVAEGLPQQRYNIPVWVYFNPQYSVEGELKVWSMTSRQYDALSKLYDAGSLNFVDMNVLSQKSGKRTDLTYTPIQGDPLLVYADPGLLEQIKLEVDNFYNTGENTLHRPMNQASWEDVYRSMGQDPSYLSQELLPEGTGGTQYLPPPQFPSQFPNQFQTQTAPPVGGIPGRAPEPVRSNPFPKPQTFNNPPPQFPKPGFQNQGFPQKAFSNQQQQGASFKAPPVQPVANPLQGGPRPVNSFPVQNQNPGFSGIPQGNPGHVNPGFHGGAKVVPDESINLADDIEEAEISQEELKGLID